MANVNLVACCRDAGEAIAATLHAQIDAIEREGPAVIAVQIPVRPGRGAERWDVGVQMNIRDRAGYLQGEGAGLLERATERLRAVVTEQLDALPEIVADVTVNVDLFGETPVWVTVTRRHAPAQGQVFFQV